ncbi:MAG: dienelactone hydrolase family protein [Pseudomonadota bacterium]
MLKRFVFSLALFVLSAVSPFAQDRVSFTAADGLEVTADLYLGDGPALILFHMAGASRGEYRDIAPRLQAAGYAVLAVDQRSGGAFGGVTNETAARAGGGAGYEAAIPDLLAATAFMRSRGATRIGVVGSSYSAALVLTLAGRDAGFADAVIAFSPGEYFSPRDFVRRDAGNIVVPVFITAARSEEGQWRPIYDVVTSEKTGFVPDGAGRHGATALLTDAGPEYWAALEAFLARHLAFDGS